MRSGGQARGRSTSSTPTNYTSVVTVARRAGSALRAGKKRHHRSDRAGGITAVRTKLRLALAARNKELRVERARSDTLAAQHSTISNELKRVQESSDEARRANNARLQAVSRTGSLFYGTASLFYGLQKREERHALELKNVKDQAELATATIGLSSRGPRRRWPASARNVTGRARTQPVTTASDSWLVQR